MASTELTIDVYTMNPQLTPIVAYVVPVFNQEDQIAHCLESLVACATLPAELVIVVDGSTDGTASAVERWIEATVERLDTELVKVIVARALTSVFETMSDTIGVALSTAPYIIEVQADMTMDHPAFDQLMTSWLGNTDDVLAVSGRGAHSFSYAGLSPRTGILSHFRRFFSRANSFARKNSDSYSPNAFEYFLSDSIGRVGIAVDRNAPIGGPKRLYLHETVMRGPLAIRRDMLERLGGLDTRSFFLGNDDHDLSMRAWNDLGLRVGYTPVRFDSPIDIGSTRRMRTANEQIEFNSLKERFETAALASALVIGASTYKAPPRKILTEKA